MAPDTLYKWLPQILLIWGEQDLWSPVEFGHRFAADIPNAKLAVLPNCGHVPQEEKPEEVARLVRAFWPEIRPAEKLFFCFFQMSFVTFH